MFAIDELLKAFPELSQCNRSTPEKLALAKQIMSMVFNIPIYTFIPNHAD